LALRPHSAFVCFVWISEKKSIISYTASPGLCIVTDTEYTYCPVRTVSSYIIQANISP